MAFDGLTLRIIKNSLEKAAYHVALRGGAHHFIAGGDHCVCHNDPLPSRQAVFVRDHCGCGGDGGCVFRLRLGGE